MFWKKVLTKPAGAARPIYLHTVSDASNDTLIAVGRHPAPLVLLFESMLNTIYFSSVPTDPKVAQSLVPSTCPEWSVNRTKRALYKTNPAAVTSEMRDRCVFAAKKVRAFEQALHSINRHRDRVATGLFMQEMIYAEKEHQAQQFRDANFETTPGPYVAQYAEYAGISPQQAAEEILFQAQLDREHLKHTEYTRLRLFGKLKRAATAEELDVIFAEFYEGGTV